MFAYRLLLLALLLSPTLARAQSLVICHVGGPGSTAQAKPVLDKFLRHMEQAGGLAAGSMTGEYHTTLAGCQGYIKQHSPLLGVFDLGTYLGRRKELKLTPLACMGSPNGQRYHVLVRKGSYKDLAALKGKSLISTVTDPRFVSRVVLDGKLDVSQQVKLSITTRALKGIRKVSRAKADAVLVDQMAQDNLEELKLSTPLESIYRSAGLPGLTLAVLGVAKPNPAVVKKIASSLPRLCTGNGKSMCKTFQVTSFIPVKSAAYAPLVKKYGK